MTDHARHISPEFLFLGEAMALDFVNTAIVLRGKPRDLLATPADLIAWQDVARAHYPSEGLEPALGIGSAEELLAPAKAFRDALRGLFEAAAQQAPVADVDLSALNQVLRDGFLEVESDAAGELRQFWRSHDSGSEGMLLPIARSAATLLTESDRSRLHRCANDRCVLLFYDTTKSGTRRWCSTSCMNRARSSRRYRERRANRA